MRTDLSPEIEGDTDERLSWRSWLLVPLMLVGLAGVVVPFMRPSAPTFSTRPRLEQETPELDTYRGELAPLLRRPDLDALTRSVIERFHGRMMEKMERDGGISSADRRRVEQILRDHR